ncbi:uncharacterized protein NECHADRAFT_53038 [Fusarium vanettenii 77-13-4]|uniref:Zn(2)-C6 fungal-type domain-containing protein n=1 Tax=Fusarium vanettenii (strain ATCC MYA-4622 / CBS 123669 / FGSC 9596 / NRRL 45880 / 77-13-4) TaxID=660122 RepID=C7ZIP1_FUSV7|nr:uncharacterized protein NECHADRAFT_53038 [Fusarium vanettenii 77-13-4]EEU36122.1 hypothetical protein NECHADRAFT_53038 [Fusarium vanettenii 77-13-4]
MSPEPESDNPAAERSTTRSCYACRRKKIKCDRNDPCSACVRSAKTCVFPPIGPRVRRTKKTIMADMAGRLASLEKTLARVTAERQATSIPDIFVFDNAESTEEGSERSNDDVLLQRGSSSQYFNEILLSRMIGEEKNLESALTAPTPLRLGTSPSPFSAMGILSSPSLSQHPSIFHPDKPIAAELWNTYASNVESCLGLRILHIPTDEVRVYSAIHNPTKAPFDDLAFCFAIYFASTMSLEEPDAPAMLILDKPRQLQLFKAALRVHNRGKGIWILNGLAIRIAQSLGLHRDGERLGLPPFESELRRRLWWHLITRDSRSGEDYGLENSTGMQPQSDVKLPLNINDEDLSPDMKQLPPEKRGWTIMTFSLVYIELAKAIQKLATAVSSPSPSEEARRKIIEETRSKVMRRVDECGLESSGLPQYRLTVHCAHFLLRKLDFFTRQQWLALQHPGSREALATDDDLLEALDILEPRVFGDEPLLGPYGWARKAYPQYHVTMYILWHLCTRPNGPHVERAWRSVEAVFSTELADEFADRVGSKPAVLAALKLKAEALRKQSAINLGNRPLEEPGESQGIPVGAFDGLSFENSTLDNGGDEWLPWTSMMQGISEEEAFPWFW